MSGNLTMVEYKFNVKGRSLKHLEELAERRAKLFFGEEAFSMQMEAHSTPDAGENAEWAFTAHVRVWRRRDYEG